MRNKKKLLLEQLDKKLKPFLLAKNVIIPNKGWIYNIRVALNMSLDQLGKRLNMTRQGIKKIEEREFSESISIKSLKEIGRALDMQFVYGFVPKHNSLENTVNIKAEELARKIVLRTNQNMKLENQGNSDKQIKRAIIDLTDELKKEMNKALWD